MRNGATHVGLPRANTPPRVPPCTPGKCFTPEYVQRLMEGDAEIAHDFVSYFATFLLAKLRAAGTSRHAAEDIRQETLLRVLRVLKRNGLADPKRITAFVNGVCNNVLAEHYRATARLSPLPEGFDACGDDQDPEIEFVAEERSQQVRRILETLPAKDRELLHLVFFEEKERSEVCRVCRVDRGYLRVLLHRAKNRFREEFEPVC